MTQKIVEWFVFSILTFNAIFTNGCWEKLKNADDIVNASDNCYVKLNLSEADLPQGVDQWVAKDFDDKCHSRCIMSEMHQLYENNTISLPGVLKTIDDNLPLTTKDKLTALLKDCYAKYEKQKQETGKGDNCKIIKEFLVCHYLQSEKFC